MDIDIKALKQEIKGRNRADVIQNCIKKLLNNVEELSQTLEFFKLPLNTIFSVISQIDFSDIDDEKEQFNILHNFVKNTVENHMKEKESIFLLYFIDPNQLSISPENYLNILNVYSNCPFISTTCEYSLEEFHLLFVDDTDKLLKKDEEIDNLNEQVKKLEETKKSYAKKIRQKDKLIQNYKEYIQQEQGRIQIDYANMLEEKDIKIAELESRLDEQLDKLPAIDFEFIIQSQNEEIIKLKEENKKLNQLNVAMAETIRKKNEKQKGAIRKTRASKPSPMQIIQPPKPPKIPQIEERNPIITRKFQEVKNKPLDFEKSIFKASKLGKLSSVQYLIEVLHVSPIKRIKKEYSKLELWKDNTALHIAARNGRYDIVRYLIEKQNLDPNIQGFVGRTPLHEASKNGNLNIVKYLIMQSADVNAQDRMGNAPIHVAIKYGHFDIVEFLLEKNGVNVNISTIDGVTPLHCACATGDLSIIQYLLLKGANKSLQTKNGEIPSDWSSPEQSETIKELLLRY